MRLLAFVMPVMLANRIVLSAYLILLPLGFVRLLDRLGHSRWLSVGAFAFLWTASFNTGFIQSALGFALVPLALAEFDAFCESPSVARGLVAWLLGVATFFNHALAWGLYFGASGL